MWSGSQRGVRDRRWQFGGLALAVLLLGAFTALAQPQGKGTKEPAKEPAAEAAEVAAADAGAAEKPRPVEDEEPPPPQTGGPKLSPLNPEADEFPDGAGPAAPPNYDQLLGEIAALRGRVSALTTTLHASKLKVMVQTDGDDARISSLVITLDGGVVYRAPARFAAEEPRRVFEHGVAPGHHVVGVEIERYDARGKAYKTWQSSRFSIVVPDKKRVEAVFRVIDDSDMAEDFPEDQDGEYDLRVRLRARVID
ncbi:MAG: hypothetical protein KIT72_01330 [Polyangiaceae bacterium]|nr:hypothetical protein [Polyangiaceae bacterium]MCW5789038.1 hypothetical protein [Polyangiaceae bacterium]